MASSAADVSKFVTPQLSSVATQMSGVLDRIYQNAQENTARSESMALDQRRWQERQNLLAMEFNRQEAQKNRDWQKMMSDTAHQREVADLKAAGLNPILSASGGNGASVGSGATASGVTSSGAKGEVDTSMNSALVSLFASLYNAQSRMEEQRMSAATNMAIAEKNNATSQLISTISAAAQKYSADSNRAASKYSSDMSKQIAQLNADLNRQLKQMGIDAEFNLKEQDFQNQYALKQTFGSGHLSGDIGWLGSHIRDILGLDKKR